MRNLIVILGFICAALGLVLAILPFNKLAIIPLIIAFVLAIITIQTSKRVNKSTMPVRIILFITIIGLFLAIYRTVMDENVVEQSTESIERDKKSEEDAVEELEGIEIDD